MYLLLVTPKFGIDRRNRNFTESVIAAFGQNRNYTESLTIYTFGAVTMSSPTLSVVYYKMWDVIPQ